MTVCKFASVIPAKFCNFTFNFVYSLYVLRIIHSILKFSYMKEAGTFNKSPMGYRDCKDRYWPTHLTHLHPRAEQGWNHRKYYFTFEMAKYCYAQRSRLTRLPAYIDYQVCRDISPNFSAECFSFFFEPCAR